MTYYSDCRFSLGHKISYDSDYDFVASETNLKEMRFFIKSYFENKAVHSFCEIILFSKNYEFSM